MTELQHGPIFLERIARPLLLLHAFSGFTNVGVATHLAVYALLAKGDRFRAQLRRFSLIAPFTLLAQFCLGFLLYPVYRVQVRHAHLEHEAPFVVQLFDFKEHMAAMGALLVLTAALLVRVTQRSRGEQFAPTPRWLVATPATAGAALVWLVAAIGVYVTSFHAVGSP